MDVKSYSPGSVIRLMTLVIAILIIPLQLFCDGYVKSKEQTMVINLQANFMVSCQVKDSACDQIMRIPHIFFEF